MKKLLSLIIMIFLLCTAVTMKSTAGTATYAALVTTAGGNLNVRANSTASAGIITSIKNGSYVTVKGESGNYLYVEYSNGKHGYCHKDYLKAVSATPKTVAVTSGRLNVRSGGSMSHKIVATLNKGDKVFVLSATDNWSKILYSANKIGYVSSDFLSQSYGKVALDVLSFKQTDSRWAQVKLGSSGKTIGQIGCVTTAIAMIESYRSGKVIYPDEMSRKLTYSSSGNVYWPSDYVADTTQSGYLERLYGLVGSGKPVLFGAKTASGKQHWVVVTGFKGGDELSADGFMINDPGSSRRTTLGAFLREYPNFYKLMRY